MKVRDFIIPESLREARSVLKKLGDKGMVVAGGTALHFFGDTERTVVDISRLALSGIKKRTGGFRIGATTTLADLMRYRGKGWILDQVAAQTSSQQIRNISTLGGNIVRVFPWADWPVVLLALDAVFHVDGKKKRSIPAAEFFESQPFRLFKAGDLLVSVDVPVLKKGQGFGYSKQKRVQAGFSLMTAAAMMTVKAGVIQKVRVAVGAAIPFPRRLTEVETALQSQPADEASLGPVVMEGAKNLSWKGKEGMSDEYAAHLAQVTVTDVLAAALRRAKGDAS
ncbi:MAG: FAD binding domain-containing protein [Lentisphaerota bacterium]